MNRRRFSYRPCVRHSSPVRSGPSISLRIFTSFWLTTALFLLVPGCLTVGPDYEPPAPNVPGSYRSRLTVSEKQSPVDLARWWEHLHDERLSQLLELAVQDNFSLQEGRERLIAARARLGIARAAWFPSVRAGASRTSTLRKDTYRPKENPTALAFKSTGQIIADELERRQSVGVKSTNLYSAGFDAGWELDIFGRTRRSVETARADLDSVHEDYNDLLVSLLAEVAVNYVRVVSYKEQLRIAEENLKRQAEAAQLVEWRHKAGLVGQLDLEQARLSMQTTRASLPNLRAGLQTSLNSLAFLVGKQVGEIDDQFAVPLQLPTPSTNLVIGIPADTIRRRPDVRRAERELAAQTARIGIATADLYPTFTIPGSVGIEALSGDQFRSGNARSASIGLGFNWTLFDGGAIRRNIEVQDSLRKQLLIRYRSTVLAALVEVENSMVSYTLQDERVRALIAAEKSARAAADLSIKEYQAGLTNFETVISAQQRLLSIQTDLNTARTELVTTTISLYKALGGGWKSGK